jgi:hypothetical protein
MSFLVFEINEMIIPSTIPISSNNYRSAFLFADDYKKICHLHIIYFHKRKSEIRIHQHNKTFLAIQEVF